MIGPVRRILLWSPRVLGILVSLFVGMFALDAFQEGQTLLEGLLAFAVHASPALFLLGVVTVSWRREWVGGAVFSLLALLYAATTLHRPDWILAIAGPLVLVGVLFLVSWRHHAELHARRGP